MGSPDMKLQRRTTGEAHWMPYSNRYYGHKGSRNDNVEDSEEFIRRSPDIKRDRQITGGCRLDIVLQ